MGKEAISEYELQRQANIAERDALLKQLSLDATSAGFGSKRAKNAISGSKAPKKRAPAKKIKEEVVPRRTSSRIKGLEADSEVAKRKAEDEYEAVQEAARIKRQRVSGDLDLKDIVVTGSGWDKTQNMFGDVVNRGAQPYERTFGDSEVKATTDKELRELREKMSGLGLYEGFEPNREWLSKLLRPTAYKLAGIKITPERIYSMGFHPEPGKPLIFAGDKLGNLGIFDASQSGSDDRGIKSEDDEEDDDSDPDITSFHLHTRTISSFQFSLNNPSHLYSCSYDSSIRLLDLATSKSIEVYGPDDREADEPLSGLELDPVSPHVIYFSRLDGYIGRHDTRASKSATTLWQMSEKKIGGFSVHPQYPHYLATASLDRTMKLWDLRKTVWWEGEDKRPALLGEHTSRLSVSHAAFNGVGQVATSSYDDTVKIYTFENMSEWKEGKPLETDLMDPGTVVKHNNQTGRWVTMYVAIPHRNGAAQADRLQIATTMASASCGLGTEIRYWQYEPLRRRLYRRRTAIGPAR